MPRLKESCKQDLKLRISIVDVVSRVATPRRAGGNRFKALCPFHQEKSPSFHFDADKGFYKCFGCGKAGDIFTFVQETEGLNFTEAVEALAQRFNVPLEYEEGGGGPSREERSLRQELFDLHEFATEHLHQAFRGSGDAAAWMRDYWVNNRRFPAELADEFKIGLADAQCSGLGAAILRRKFSEAAIRQCGLFYIYDDALLTVQALKPRFRGRLMIPIRDHQGRVVAFTARQTALTPQDDNSREAKYVNSPETPIFTKGNLLFNLDRARAHAGEGKPFVMVEGQLDALRCWSVGLKTAIAPQGTSITEGQLLLLRRYHSELECFFDSDGAGQKAALRLLPLALKTGIEVRFLTLAGAGKIDPDLLFLEKGLAGYDEVKKQAIGGMRFAAKALLPNPLNASPQALNTAAKELVALINHAESQVTRMAMADEAAKSIGLTNGEALNALLIDSKVFNQVGGLTPTHQTAARPFGGSAAHPSASSVPSRNQPPAPPSPAADPDYDPAYGNPYAYEAPPGASPSRTSSPAPGARLQPHRPAPPDDATAPERDLLLIVLHFSELGKPLAHACPHEWIDERLPSGALLNRFLAEFSEDQWPGRDHLDNLLETDAERALVASILFETPMIDSPGKVAVEGLTRLRNRALAPRMRQIELQLSQAATDNTFDATALLKERSDLQRRLRSPLALTAVA